MTDVWEKAILNHLFRNTALGLDATNMWVCLFTATPSDSATGTEVTGGSYARVAVNRTGTGWNAATGTLALVDNAAAVTFPTATADWGTITAFGITKSAAGALSTDLIYWGTLTVSKAILNGDIAQFLAGALDITQD
jgi:hypothetical protein